MMRYWSTIAVLLVLVTAGAMPARAIDVKKKPGATSPATQPSGGPTDTSKSQPAGAARTATSESLLERLKSQVRESSKTADTARYDNYIDANNDGVDDRVKEKRTSGDVEKTKAKSQPTPKDDTARTRTKKKPR